MVRALVVDDEEDMRVLLAAQIAAANNGLVLVGEVESGVQAIERCRQDPPDVVVLDQRMPGMTGVEAARVLADEHPDIDLILFSAFVTDDVAAEAIAAGVSAVIPKSDLPGLIRALHAADRS